MSEQAQPQTEELKKHGDPLESAEETLGAHSSKEEDADVTEQKGKEE